MNEGREWIHYSLKWRSLCSSGRVRNRLVGGHLAIRRHMAESPPRSVSNDKINRLSNFITSKSHLPLPTDDPSALPPRLFYIALYAPYSFDPLNQDSDRRRSRSSLCRNFKLSRHLVWVDLGGLDGTLVEEKGYEEGEDQERWRG